MAYDTGLAERIRDVVIDRADVFEREMFGGIAFLREGRMFVGIVRDTLMVRVGRDDHDAAIAHEHARPMDFTGRPMRGMVYVSPDGIAEDTDLEFWVDWGYRRALDEPAKPKKKKAIEKPETEKVAATMLSARKAPAKPPAAKKPVAKKPVLKKPAAEKKTAKPKAIAGKKPAKPKTAARKPSSKPVKPPRK